jgi:DNA invertase Pin-like site-specific DNA recombinase
VRARAGSLVLSREVVRWHGAAFCDANHLATVCHLKKSGDTLQRPAFEELQAAIFAGEIGTVVVAEMEQETRRERQAAGIVVAKAEGKYRGHEKGTTKAKLGISETRALLRRR